MASKCDVCSSQLVYILVYTAVADEGISGTGGTLRKDFFKEEYKLNNTIGKINEIDVFMVRLCAHYVQMIMAAATCIYQNSHVNDQFITCMMHAIQSCIYAEPEPAFALAKRNAGSWYKISICNSLRVKRKNPGYEFSISSLACNLCLKYGNDNNTVSELIYVFCN